MIPVSEIIPYENNPRKNDKAVDFVANSIKNFGFKVPLIIDKNNVIVTGHTRLKAAIKLGLKEVPVIWADDLTENQIKAFRIADNKTSEYSDWDLDLLKGEFESLDEKGIDLELTGFELKEIGDILDKQETKDDGFVEVDAYERAKNKSKVKMGDIYQLGEHRLMCGDSTNKEDVENLFRKSNSNGNGGQAILMVTDPPYGVEYNPKWRDEADKKGILGNKYPVRSLGIVKNDDNVDWSKAYELFEGDIVYVWHAGRHASEVQRNIEKSGFEIICQIIWKKPHFVLSRGDYHWCHEPCWYAVRKGKQHNWQGSRTEDTIWEIAGMNCMGGTHDKADERTGHGTQKPIECMSKPIRNNTKKGDSVYDPFGGSGTTLIACEQLNRKCLMMEIDPVYCQIIMDRWEKLTGKQAVKLN